MTELTPERLAELRALATAATPGPYGVESWLDPEFLERQWAIVVPEAPHSRMIAKVFGDNAVWLERGQFGENAHYFAALDPDTVRELVDGYEDRAEQRESVHKLASLLQDSHKRAQRYAAALRQMSGWYEDVEIARRALEEK